MDKPDNWQHANLQPPLQPDAVHVWLCRLDVAENALEQFMIFLDYDETARSTRLANSTLKRRFVVAHAFMRGVLSQYAHQNADELVFVRGEYGKPTLINSQLHFNLSHSRELAILAIAGKPVGIDVEFMDMQCEWKEIMQRFYTGIEVSKILELPLEKQYEAFLKVWTRKEAHMKVTGQGLHLSPSEFTVSVPPEDAELNFLASEQDVKQWSMYDLALPDTAREYRACLSVEGPVSRIEKYIYDVSSIYGESEPVIV